MNEQDIFLAALEIDEPVERGRFLDQACGQDGTLREQVEALLRIRERKQNFLEVPALQQLADQAASEQQQSRRKRGSPADFSPVECNLSFLAPSQMDGSLGRIQHFEIQQVIGRGGFGVVLKAFDTRLHRVVAIKVMLAELAVTSPARKRFLREARSAAAVRQDNIVNIYAVEDDPLPFLVMEYIDGLTLQQKLDKTGPLELIEIVKIGRQIARGLVAAHAKGLIHRDIKPANILLENGGERVVLTDFGLARAADDASLTQSGFIAGTPLYMSPEQAQGRKIDSRSDLFSLGSVLYVMCSGRPPFRAPSTIAVIRRVVFEQPRPIQEIIPEIPQWLLILIGKLHVKRPAERCRSALHVEQFFELALKGLQQGRNLNFPSPELEEAAWQDLGFLEGGPDSPEKTPSEPESTGGGEWFKKLLPFALGGLKGSGKFTRTLLWVAGVMLLMVGLMGIGRGLRSIGLLTSQPEEQQAELSPGESEGDALAEQETAASKVPPGVMEAAANSSAEETSGENLTGRKSEHAAVGDVTEPASPLQLTADADGLPERVENALGLKFARIPRGGAWLGGGKDYWGRRRIEFSEDFYLGVYEVTQQQWAAVMGLNPSYFQRSPRTESVLGQLSEAEIEQFPVENIGTVDAFEFLQRLNEKYPVEGWVYRLPTDAEWEYACRGGPMASQEESAFDYYLDQPTNELTSAQANIGHALQRPAPVGSYPPNSLGLYDMHGNVYELCADLQIEDDGITYYSRRGGGYFLGATENKTTKRNYNTADFRNGIAGLRVALVPAARAYDAEPDMIAARYVLAIGGAVKIAGSERRIARFADLPNAAFEVHEIHLWANPQANNAELNSIFRNLRELRLLNLDYAAHTSDAVLESLKHNRQLKVVSLARNELNGKGLRRLSQFPELTSFSFGEAALTDETIELLRENQQLTHVWLYETRITDRSLAFLKQFPKLTSLNVGKTNITDQGLQQVADYPALLDLEVQGTKLTDAGWMSLAKSSRLRKLNASETGLTDAGLVSLAKISTLKHLDVSHTEVTEAGLNAFRKELPSCQVKAALRTRLRDQSPASPVQTPHELLASPAIWAGTRTYTAGVFAGSTVSYEIEIQHVDATSFQGVITHNGPGSNRTEVTGTIEGARLKWAEQGAGFSLQVQGDIRGTQLEVNFSGRLASENLVEGTGQLQIDSPVELSTLPVDQHIRRPLHISKHDWAGRFRLENGELTQERNGWSVITFGERHWTDYDLQFETMILEGTGGGVFFRERKEYETLNLSIMNNSRRLFKTFGRGRHTELAELSVSPLPLKEWHQVLVSCRGPRIRVELNGVEIFDATDEQVLNGSVGFITFESAMKWRNLTVKSPTGDLLWSGFPEIPRAFQPPPRRVDVDRTAAEWVFSLGGTVQINGDGKEYTAWGELPNATDWRLTGVRLADNGKVTDEGILEHLTGTTSLRHVNFNYSRNVTDAALKALAGNTNLRDLYLMQTQVTGAGFYFLQDCREIFFLQLSLSPIRDEHLRYLSEGKRLDLLWIADTRTISSECLRYLKSHKKLYTLSVRNTRFDDEGLAELHHLPNLARLDLSYSTHITDVGLRHLQATKVRELWLVRTKLTDAGLRELIAVPTLKELDISGSPMSAAAIAEFRKKRPDCVVKTE